MREKIRVNSELFLIGSVGYGLLEVVWRGFTHWTMVLTGGACFTAIYYLSGKYGRKPLLARGLMGSTVITAVEFVVGSVVNRGLHWNVWDYSRLPLNLCGQICLRYSAYWFVLSMPLFWLCGKLRTHFGKRLPEKRQTLQAAPASGRALPVSLRK